MNSLSFLISATNIIAFSDRLNQVCERNNRSFSTLIFQ